MLSMYVPLVTLGILAFGFAVFSVVLATIVGPGRYNRAKYDPYECGIEPVDQPLGAGRFPVKYYLTAMLFIIFDVETIFLYPFAVSMGLLKDHLEHCVANAAREGGQVAQEKFDEAMTAIRRLAR